MKKNILRILILILVTVLSISLLVGCKKHEEEGKKEEVTSNGIKAEVTEALLIKGESFTLGYEFDPKEAKGEVEFSSDNDTVTVDKDGKITAAKAGSCIVTVKEKEGDKYAQCKVVVGDLIVDSKATAPSTPVSSGGSVSLSRAQNDMVTTATDGRSGDSQSESGNDENKNEVVKNYGGVYGSTLFKTVQEAISHATEGNTILVKEGTYSEDVTISKSINLMGVKNPQLRGIEISSNLTVELKGLTIVDKDYPVGTKARVMVKSGASLKMEDCILTTTSKEKLTGGYGVLVEKQAKKIEIKNNTISNLRYGIYVCPTDGEVNIEKNDFSNLEVGVGVDIRQENSDMNYPTTGEINMNTYNEVEAHTQFLHYGDSYQGDFKFEDNEKDNAATDEGPTGGSGLTE